MHMFVLLIHRDLVTEQNADSLEVVIEAIRSLGLVSLTRCLGVECSLSTMPPKHLAHDE